MEILDAVTPAQVAEVRILFQEYADWLKVDLCFQGFAEELKTLPGVYASPQGRLLLAMDGDTPAGCVAMRPADGSACEMKRLYAKQAYQGRGLGRALAEKVISEARQAGYSTMRLDTLPFMHNAMSLYETLGFRRRTAYYDTPIGGTVFMELFL